jgi:hypothetical protein
MVRVDNMGQNFFATPASIWPKEVKGNEKYHSGDDHVRNFLECIKSRSEPAAPVEIGHRSASLCHLGNIAIKLRAKLKWDPKAEHFVGSQREEANALLNRPARESWAT